MTVQVTGMLTDIQWHSVSCDSQTWVNGVFVVEITAQSQKLFKDALFIKEPGGGVGGFGSAEVTEAVTHSIIS